MGVLQSPSGAEVVSHGTASLVSLRAALASRSAQLDRVLDLRNKLETMAASTDKSKTETAIHQRAAALDKLIDGHEGCILKLQQDIDRATATEPVALAVIPTQPRSETTMEAELRDEPEALVVQPPCKDPQEVPAVVPTTILLPQDFSDVLADDWSHVQRKEDWLAPADDTDANVDLSDVFGADDNYTERNLQVKPKEDLEAKPSDTPNPHPQHEELSLPTEEELLNDSVLNEAFCSASPLNCSNLTAPEPSSLAAEGEVLLEAQPELRDPFLDTLCVGLDDTALLHDHDMLLTEADAALPSVSAADCADTAIPFSCNLQPADTPPATIAEHAFNALLIDEEPGSFIGENIGCPVVDLMFDLDLDNEFASGEYVQLCCSVSDQDQQHSAVAIVPVVGDAPVCSGSGVPVSGYYSGDGAASGHKARTLRAAEPSTDRQNPTGDSYTIRQLCTGSYSACMHDGAPSESDSEVVLDWGSSDSGALNQRGGHRERRPHQVVSLTHAETNALPDILSAAQRVRHALAPRQCDQHAKPQRANACGKENSSAGVTKGRTAKFAVQQGAGRGSKQGHRVANWDVESDEIDSEDEWIPHIKKSPTTRRKPRAGKPSSPQTAVPASPACVSSHTTASISTASEEANGSVFVVAELSTEPSTAQPSAPASEPVNDSSEHPTRSSTRTKKPLKLKLKASCRKRADSAVAADAQPDEQQQKDKHPASSSPPASSPTVEPSSKVDHFGSSSCNNTSNTVSNDSVADQNAAVVEPAAAAQFLSKPATSAECRCGPPSYTTDSGKSVSASTHPATPPSEQQEAHNESVSGADASRDKPECDSSIRKKRRVSVCNPDPVSSPIKPAAPTTVAAYSDSTDTAPAKKSASVCLPVSTASSTEPSNATTTTSATIQPRNPLKRTLESSKPSTTTDNTSVTTTQSPLPSTSAAPAEPRPQSKAQHCSSDPSKHYAFKSRTIEVYIRETPPAAKFSPVTCKSLPPQVSSHAVLPPKPPRCPPPAIVAVTATGAPPPPPQRAWPVMIPQPPKCPPLTLSGPPTAYPPRHPAPGAPQQRVAAMTHVITAPPTAAPVHHAHTPCIGPLHKPRAPNAMYPSTLSLRSQQTSATNAPPPLMAGALGRVHAPTPPTHTPKPPTCPPPPATATPTSNDCARLKMEPMPDLSVLCDIMRAAETPVPTDCTSTHDRMHVNESQQVATSPIAPESGNRTSSHCVHVEPKDSTHKSRRERLKALTQGSSRNLGEWGRRQGYHRERVKSAEKRRVRKDQHRSIAKMPPRSNVYKAGRSQEAMRNRGNQPLEGSTCRKDNKRNIALPDDTDLFGC